MVNTNGFLERYVARGWRTVPVHRPNPDTGGCSCGKLDCPKPGKHPDSRYWPGDSAEPGHFADRNLGVRLGPDSKNLADVDLDCGEAVAVGPLLLTKTNCMFGRGGQATHSLFTVTDAAASFAKLQDPARTGRESTIVELRWPEWDEDESRFKAVQTVFPPSLHFSGNTIEWIKDGDPGEVLGADLVAAVRQIAAAVLIARYARPKERHALVLLIANLLVRAGWADDAKIVRFMAAVFTAKNDLDKVAKITDGEGAGAVKDARARHKNKKPMTGLPALQEMLDSALDEATAKKVVPRIAEWLGVPASMNEDASSQRNTGTGPLPWPQPVPLTVAPNVPPYPEGILSPWLQTWADAVALELQVPVDLPAGLGLGLVAAGIARKVIVKPRAGFTEPTNLFVMVALPPGDRKTQTFRRAIAPVQKLQHEAREAAGPAIIEAESQHRIADKKVKHLEDKISKATEPGEKEQLFEDLKAAREELANAEVPPSPVFYTEDDTPESLKQELIRQGGRMVVATTEARCLENITLYSDRPNFDVYLKGHAGDEMNSGRVGRGRDMVTEPALSCLLSPQPAVLQGLAEDEILRGRGFLARWLFGLPESRVGFRQVAAPAVADAVLNEYQQRVRAAWEIGYGQSEEGEPAPHVIRFSPEAATEFEEFERWIEPQLAPGSPLARLAGWANKLNGECARIAAALHVADALGTGQSWATPISVGIVRRAIRLCREYLIAHAQAAFDLMGADVKLASARLVWSWITRTHRTEFTKRDCFNGLRAKFDTVDELQPSLDLLERHYLIRPRKGQERQGPGRSPSPIYDVNPEAGGGDEPPQSPGDGPPDSSPPGPQLNSAYCAYSARGVTSPPERLDGAIEEEEADGKTIVDLPNVVTDANLPTGPLAHNTHNTHNSISARAGNSSSYGDRIVITAPELLDLITSIREATVSIGLDTETTGLNPARDQVRLLQLAVGEEVYLIDLFQSPDQAPAIAPLFVVLAEKEIVGHNITAFDLPFLARLGFAPSRVFDTAIASRVVYAGEKIDHDLASVVHREVVRVLDKAEQRSDWSKPVLTQSQLAYAAADVSVLVPLAAILREKAAARKVDAVMDLEMRCALPVTRMAARGVGFDVEPWNTLADSSAERKRTLVTEMNTLVPNPNCLPGMAGWNWDSNTVEVLRAFASVGITLKDTKEETLAGTDHPLARLLLDYREATKKTSTYGRTWVDEHVTNGRVYASWNLCQAKTGRMSCSRPNLQQIPRNAAYRRCFVARPGHVLVKCDFSQIELRIAAKVTGDKRMLAAYKNGEDLHTLTAARFLGVATSAVTKEVRQMAKPVNFGAIYGLGSRSLRLKAKAEYGKDMTERQAKGFLDAFFAEFAGVRVWHNKIKRQKATEVRTLGGRRIAVEPDQFYGAKANYVVQGTGGDGLKRALVLLWERRAEYPNAEPVLAVHDEVVLEVPEADAEQAKAWLERCMIDAMAPLIDPVPVEVESKVSRTWGG